jgi:hypothetical protein
MGVKEDAIKELLAVQREFGLSPTHLGLEIMNDPSFIPRLHQKKTRVTNVTLDKINRYVLRLRGQMDLELERK